MMFTGGIAARRFSAWDHSMALPMLRRPSVPLGGFDRRKSRHERLANEERFKRLPVSQLSESEEDYEEDHNEHDEDTGCSEDSNEENYSRKKGGDNCRRGDTRCKSGPNKRKETSGPNYSRLQQIQGSESENCRKSPRTQSSKSKDSGGVADMSARSSPNLLQTRPLARACQCRTGLCLCDSFTRRNSKCRVNNNAAVHKRKRKCLSDDSYYSTSRYNDASGNSAAGDNICNSDDDKRAPERQQERRVCEDIGREGKVVEKNEHNIHYEKKTDNTGNLGSCGRSKDECKKHSNGSVEKRRSRRSRETVIINVGGQTFETYRSTLRRLRTPIFHSDATLQRYYRRQQGDYFFDRDPAAFGSILNFLRTGELHIPTNMCGPALQMELEFWGIDEMDIARCCWTQYNTWKTQCRSLEKLEYDRKFSTTQQVSNVGSDASRWTKFRSKVWILLQDPGSSRKAKAYAWISIIFVFMSIFSFCAETHPLMKVKARDVTHLASVYRILNVEPIQFGDIKAHHETGSRTGQSLSDNGSVPVAGVRDTLNISSLSNGSLSPSIHASADFLVATPTAKMSSSHIDKREVKEENVAEPDGRTICEDNTEKTSLKRRGWLLETGIDGRTNAVRVKCGGENSTERKDWGSRDLPHPALLFIDLSCLAFFTLEYLTRFTCSPNKLDFLRALQNIVDLLAFAPDYVGMLFVLLGPDTGQGKEGVAVMEMLFILRVLRLFRIFRLIRHVPGLWILLYTLKASVNELMLMCVFLLIGMVVFATLIHFAEPDMFFTNIPVGFWWAVVTMTTVGFGDMYPQSPAGYFIGSCCAVAGLLMIAFTVPIIVSNFVLYYTHVQYGLARSEHEMEIQEDEMAFEMEMLEKSRSHLDVEAGEGGERGGGEETSESDCRPHKEHTLRSQTYSIPSTIIDTSPQQESNPKYSRASINCDSAPVSRANSLHKSGENIVRLKPPPSFSDLCPTSSAAKTNTSETAATVVSAKSSDSNTTIPTLAMPFTTSLQKSYVPMTAIRNGKYYESITSKSDTDLFLRPSTSKLV